jgi:hypothetical protein
MEVIEEVKNRYDQNNNYIEFCVYSGAMLKSNNSRYMERTLNLVKKGYLHIYQDLDKNNYYNMLNNTRVLFNCALQDWVSNTISEADALGCNVLYPAYRSFPETVSNDASRMYIPWSVEDAAIKLYNMLHQPHRNQGNISDWTDKTIDRICDIIEGKGEQWLRMDKDYRQHTRESKY